MKATTGPEKAYTGHIRGTGGTIFVFFTFTFRLAGFKMVCSKSGLVPGLLLPGICNL